jgi:hypothetical protein
MQAGKAAGCGGIAAKRQWKQIAGVLFLHVFHASPWPGNV